MQVSTNKNFFSDVYDSQFDYSQTNSFENDNINNLDLLDNLDLFSLNKIESENFNEYKVYFIDLSTCYKTDYNKKKKKSEKIFSISKDKEHFHGEEVKQIKKKKGRKKRDNHKNIIVNKDINYHSKLKEDNMIHKIKVFFIQSAMNFINKRYKDFEEKKGNKKAKLLSKIKTEYTKTIKKEPNLKFLKTKVKDLFASNLSEKCTKLNKDFNKLQIMELYQSKEAKDVIEIMEKTVEELLYNYVNGDYRNEGFYIEDDLDEEKKKMIINEEEGIDDYTENLIETAKNLGNIFRSKISRRKKSKEIGEIIVNNKV